MPTCASMHSSYRSALEFCLQQEFYIMAPTHKIKLTITETHASIYKKITP